MADVRIVIAVAAAGLALALALTNALANTQLLLAGLGAVFGISTIALSVAAFVLSGKKRSYAVAGLLAATGAIFMVPALAALGDFTVIVFPGPILGVLFGLIMLGLGVAKGVGTARAKAPAAALR